MFFLPFMAQGHMIPLVDIAKLFAIRGMKSTIITTPLNAPLFSKTIERSKNSGIDIDIKILEFPCVEVGLPNGLENVESITSEMGVETVNKFFKATALLQEPLEQLLQEFKPDCLVADIQYEPHKKVVSDSEPFLVPYFPGNVMFMRKQLPEYVTHDFESSFSKLIKVSRETEGKCYGVIVNSFYELEAAYADYYRNVLGRKAWHIGPVSLSNKAIEDKAERGKKTSVSERECLKWLNLQKPNSVIYICFGSMARLNSAQLKEIAMGLEASGQGFIWVVRKEKNSEEEEGWLPEGFEKRMEGKGLIIRGWAPQVLILEHHAIGGFVTHCGWNSALEGVCAGVPMVTWPLSGEQFYNEKLVTQVLEIGVAVGVQKSVKRVGDFVRREALEKAVKKIVVGERAYEMRSRAKAIGEMARKATEKGGSSYSNLNALIEDLKSLRCR
ncbi:hypothetical protein SLEP1_g14154 [Rubroshorea leprosula]|uniref:Glycosyltransferase n=1 Tax=Rubroshorea leprosula TaxID=152421 RepID=A0AAV5INY5_9ROSI|nr:hypothetical protein SLEP1_g14154 [Rubroshorea leprosula]